MSEMPKEGYTYCEISIPDKGLTLSGAMDDNSLENIINITLNADVDREHTRADLAQKQPEMSDNDVCCSEIEALDAVDRLNLHICENFINSPSLEEDYETIRTALEQAQQYRDAVRGLVKDLRFEIKRLRGVAALIDHRNPDGSLKQISDDMRRCALRLETRQALTDHAETIKRAGVE